VWKRKARWTLMVLAVGVAVAQPRVDPASSYERVIGVVPMIGKGTPEDPRRPMFAPAPGAGAALARDGIIAFSYQLSDDGRFALVEFVARTRAALAPLLTSGRSDVKLFLRGYARREEIEREFRRYKRDFNLDRFPRVTAP